MVTGPAAEPGVALPGGEEGESADAPWVRSFLISQPGKTYQVESTDDAHQAAASHAVESAARALTDDVVRSARADGQDRAGAPDKPV